jgi:hypothetical protein
MMAGIALGPHGLEIAPKHDALMLMGELGLVLMVLEAGIEVELSEVCSLVVPPKDVRPTPALRLPVSFLRPAFCVDVRFRRAQPRSLLTAALHRLTLFPSPRQRQRLGRETAVSHRSISTKATC